MSTTLFWLYIVGRLVVGAATINASVYEQSTRTPPEEPGRLLSPGKGEPS